MTTTPLQDSKFIKEINKKFDEFKNSINNEIKEIKEMIQTLEEINKEKHTLTNKDVEIAWVQFRLDYLTGVKKISSERFTLLKKYMNNIDLNNIPFELKYYIKEENIDGQNMEKSN